MVEEDPKVPVVEIRPPSLLFGMAFGCLGLLVGTLLAFSSQSVVQAVVAALFAFFGGSILAVLGNKTRAEQQAVALGTLVLSVGALVGVYSGILVNEHQLLTPANLRVAKATVVGVAASTPKKYIRAISLQMVTEIDQKLRTGFLTPEQAYDQLYKVPSTLVQLIGEIDRKRRTGVLTLEQAYGEMYTLLGE